MATPPTYVGEYETVWNTTTTPKSPANVTTLVSDILIHVAQAADIAGSTALSTPTNTGTAETFTLQESVYLSTQAPTYLWSVVCAAAQTTTISQARTGTARTWGLNVIHYRDSAGIGASEKANGSGAPSLGITTTADNSAIVMISTDWNPIDGASRTYRQVNGASPTENTYFYDSSNTTIYVARYADAGTAGAKTVGLTAPTGQAFATIAVEVKGITGAVSVPPSLIMAPPNW